MTSEIINTKAQCPICSKCLSNKNNLKTHIQTIHEKKLPFLCPYDGCSKQYPNKSRFNVHTRTHLGIKPYHCTICSQSFNECGNLKAHMNKHNEIKQFHCHLCTKEYKSKGHLKEHINIIHFLIKKYKCDVCSKEFGKKAILNDHLRTHTKEKPFKCAFEDCDKTFAEKGNMKMHFKRHLKKKKKTTTSTFFSLATACTKDLNEENLYRDDFEDDQSSSNMNNCWNDIMKEMVGNDEKKTSSIHWNEQDEWEIFDTDFNKNLL